MNLGEKILALRIKNKMSQGDLADVLSVSRQSVSKWETNTSVPELEKLLRISEVFEISVDELVRGEKTAANYKSREKLKNDQIPDFQLRKIIGFGLLGIGLIIFVLVLILDAFLSALILSSPLFITGLICILISKYTALWCGWTLYIMISLYLRYATGIRVWWIFYKWLYRSGLEIHAIIAWIMAIVLAGLVVATVRLRKKVAKHEKS